MSNRCPVDVLTAIVVVSLSAVSAGEAQTAGADEWVTPRTPWGVPDFQGVWDFQSTTPLERPSELSDKDLFTDEEAAAIQEQRLDRGSVDRRDGGAVADLARAYGEIWYIRNPVLNKRTSLVVDPPDGKILPLTPEAEQRRAARAEYLRVRGDFPDVWKDLPTYPRCISRVMPRLPQGYNSGTLVLQTPGWVLFRYEQLDIRIIPVSAHPHINERIRQWNGDSRGRWEGDTLVVDTTNFTDKQAFIGIPKGSFHLEERFTRVNAATIDYEATLTDPTTWTKPWTFLLPWQKDDSYTLFEYACHERNYSMTNILRGARAQEKASAR